MIEQNGAFITYGPEDFTPGHLEICSFQLGDPEDCPVCKTRPPFNQRRAKQLVLVAGAALAVSACAAPIVTTQPNSCSSLLPMDWRQGVELVGRVGLGVGAVTTGCGGGALTRYRCSSGRE